jgi:hypothetical protein
MQSVDVRPRNDGDPPVPSATQHPQQANLYSRAESGDQAGRIVRGLSSRCGLSLDPCNDFLDSGWRLIPKQDHLVCFLGGSLMLGATTSGALVDHVSVPPLPFELSAQGQRDWLTGVELIKTCMATHDTQTYVNPYRDCLHMLKETPQWTFSRDRTFPHPRRWNRASAI